MSKKFFNEFLWLMNHYKLIDEPVQKIWSFSMHPENFKDDPPISPSEDRETKIEALRSKKILEA